MRNLWALLSPQWRVGLWAIIATLGATAAELVIPLFTGDLVDVAVAQDTPQVFTQLSPVASAALVLILVALARWGFQFIRRYTAGLLSIDTQHVLRIQLLRTLLAIDGPTQDRIRTGQMISRSISDVQAIQGMVAMLPLAIGNILQLLVSIVIMVVISPVLACACLVWLPLIAWLARYSKGPLMEATYTAQQQAADVATHVEETVTGIQVVQGFAQQDREVRTLERAGLELFRQRLHAAAITARFQPLLEQLPQLALVGTVLLGGWLAAHGAVSVGTFVAFSMYVSRLTGVVRRLGNMSVRFHSGLASVERVTEITDLSPDLTNGTRSIPEGPLNIEFDNVKFQDSLRGLSLNVPASTTVVMAGPPAGGKTMAVQLLARFYDPDAGEIRINGISLQDFDRAELRKAMAVVFDEAFIFETSIRENVALGESYSDAELWHALRAAQAESFVQQLPGGLDAHVGERGATLSGGQRQRLALARALIRKPRILVLDDATSAIDASTEARIFQALKTEFENVTIFAITHRNSLINVADEVAIIADGKTTATGSREAMLNHPTFRQLMDLDTTIGEISKPASTAILDASVPALEPLPPGPDPQPVQIPKPFRLQPLLRQTAAGITAVIVFLLAAVAADLAFPTLVRVAVDQGVAHRNNSTLLWVSLAGVIIVIAAWIASVLRIRIAARVGERLLYALRIRSYDHLMHLDIGYFERTRTGSVLTRMTTDIDNLSTFLQTGLAQAIVATATMVGVIAMLGVTSAPLALVAVSALPIVLLMTWLFRRYNVPLYNQARTQISGINAEFHESISGVRTIQMHGVESDILARFTDLANAYRRTRYRAQLAVALYFPGTNALAQFSRVAVISVGATMVLSGDLSAGVLVAFLLYMGLLFDPIQELSQLYDSYQQARVSLRRISDLLSEQPHIHSTGTNPDAATAATGALEFHQVDFSYQESDVLTDINLTIAPNTTVALVGPTGAGKTTIMKLLARFYDPSSGEVTASGISLADFPLTQWRSALGFVPQEPYLFTGTIAENIGYGSSTPDPEKIIDAARRVGALDAIASIEDGFQYRIGERGRGLSSGQRQLIALARAEFAAPKVLLLDEATATLDPATERIVLDAAKNLTRERTSIVVAHRLATAARADRILVLDHGRIIEDGTHENLLANEGVYANMWHARE